MAKQYNVLAYGVLPDAEYLQTASVQAVIDRCWQDGGGEVVIPAGVYYVAGLMLRSNVTLHLLENTVLRGSHDPSDYEFYLHDPYSDRDDGTFSPLLLCPDGLQERIARPVMTNARSPWHKAMIRAIRSENIAVIGESGSVIDGVNCFDPNGETRFRGPHGIDFFQCENVDLRGYTIVNCGNWAHTIFFSKNIVARDIRVYGGHDGFHVRSCDNILLENADLRTGDDSVAGFDNNDLTVRNCYLNSACNAARCAGSRVLFEKCTMEGPGEYVFRCSLKRETQEKSLDTDECGRYNMLTGWCYFGDDSFIIRNQPAEIALVDCVIINADRMIHYNYSGNDPWHSNRPLASLRLKNVRAVDIRKPIVLYGDPDVPTDISFENVSISFSDDFGSENFLYLNHYSRMEMNGVRISGATDSPVILRWSGNNGDIIKENCNARVEDTDAPFSCERF